eukprot:TRINITY_DN13886_c0_g1_i1.p1 TRINITY_DN13886_c0_g1~~TRINITY_DN13886_c0_g1_i1.p1  ORF type:complete len:247 (+),score=52.80 TRINITY_DN13886_c0_g1_i1:95-835(+)
MSATQGGAFHDRVALVTGGGGGIGRAAVFAFAKEGAKVVVADIRLDLAEETCRVAVEKLGVDEESLATRLLPCQCDVADEAAVERLVAFAVKSFGALHHCFNNAGVEGTRRSLHETPYAEYQRIMAVNAGGIFNCMAKQIGQMLRQHEASGFVPESGPYSSKAIDHHRFTIVNTSSTAGQAAMPEFSPYCASKHAVIGLTRAAAKEYWWRPDCPLASSYTCKYCGHRFHLHRRQSKSINSISEVVT